MPRIATRLDGPSQLTTTAATLFTVASAEKNIVRHIHLSNPSSSAVAVTLSIGTDAAGTRIFDAFPIGPGQVFDHFCMYVLDAAEIMQGFADTASALVCTIDGERAVLG